MPRPVVIASANGLLAVTGSMLGPMSRDLILQLGDAQNEGEPFECVLGLLGEATQGMDLVQEEVRHPVRLSERLSRVGSIS